MANREEKFTPNHNIGTTVLFSLQQQAVVAQVTGFITYINAKTGRPIDIRTVSDGWVKLYEGFTRKVEMATALLQKWEEEHPPKTQTKL